MFNPVEAEEMAFAISIFVHAAGNHVFPSGPPDARRTLREARACARFLTLLAPTGKRNHSLPEATVAQGSALFQAVFAVWEHDRKNARRLSLVARLLAFYSLVERTRGAAVARWCDTDPDGDETVLLHPAVVQAIATVPLGPRGERKISSRPWKPSLKLTLRARSR